MRRGLGLPWLALKMEEGAANQRICVGLRSREREVNGFYPRASRRKTVLPDLDYSLVRPTETSGLLKCKIIKLCLNY